MRKPSSFISDLALSLHRYKIDDFMCCCSKTRVDCWVQHHEFSDCPGRKALLETFGPVRSVKPTLVFELGFEGIARNSRHKSGIAVRFPRMLRW